QGTQTISVNNGQPDFTSEDLDTSHGAWQQYGNLDRLNLATQANALLNRSLMPKAKREPLNVTPTGWHNK
ncbi:DNA/RNA non-specific endonuclease, partial [Bifidobacterium longum]|nr:DNA/RNA non-specific endonuclease [Bifidobacterium longum]